MKSFYYARERRGMKSLLKAAAHASSQVTLEFAAADNSNIAVPPTQAQ